MSESGEQVLTYVTTASASKDVILCGGSIDTPKLLMLNGIGPKAELEDLGIEVKNNLPGVGKHLQDHVLTIVSVEVDGSVNDRWAFESDHKLMTEAQELWDKDRSGALGLQSSVMWGGFHKLPGLEDTKEFQQLAKDQQEFLTRDAVPTYEYINGGMMWPPGTQLDKGSSYMTMFAFLMNPQSEGSVTLRSKDPNDKPVIKLNYLTHPYDAMVFREAIRNLWNKIILNPVIAPTVKRTLSGPASTSDEDLDAFARDNAGTVWHANGTVKMGKKGEEGACVDSSGRVFGVQGLRVADLSVCRHTTNNHTQATAYLVGQKMGEKLIREYGLEKGLERMDSKLA
jgi:choline dehydrogenase-like flavoprotein